MTEYKVIEIPRNAKATETLLNRMSQQGWKVTQITNYQLFLEREKAVEEEKHLLHD